MPKIEFTIWCEPKAQQRHRTCKNEHRYDPSKSDKADFLAQAIQYKPDKPITGPVQLVITALFSRPKKHYRTGKHSKVLRDDAPRDHIVKPDSDNIAKFVMDALTGVFWVNDCVIYYHCCVKLYTSYKSCVIVQIEY